MSSADKDILYRVAYDEAVRALAEQQAEIDSFRSRAGLLLSSAAITTSFLGAQSFDGDGLTATSWLALLAFIGAAAISLAILWPRPWELTANPRDVIEPYLREEESVPIDELHSELSFHMHSSFVENERASNILPSSFKLRVGFWSSRLFSGSSSSQPVSKEKAMAKTGPKASSFEPKTPSPMQPSMLPMSWKRFWRILLGRNVP